MKKILFIDRDGTLIEEPPVTYQVDSFEVLRFLPGVITWLSKIASQSDYELVMVTNQDGLGTDSFPEKTFWPVHNFMLQTLLGEGIRFEEVLIDRSFEKDNSPNRKPRTGMLTKYMNGQYDLSSSYVIGDRLTDVQLAKNLGCKSILISKESNNTEADYNCKSWKEIYDCLILKPRTAVVQRKTKETDIRVELNLDTTGDCDIDTGLKFFDHMLEQIAKHGSMSMKIKCKGDLQVDEHHTIEDTAITFGEAFLKAIGNKRGIERYGFCLPMDDAIAQTALDLGGRNWIEWQVAFKREKIGDVPTEMFFHFFKSFSDSARCNLNISATGNNEHHKIEAVFKSFAKALSMAKKINYEQMELPSTKGTLT